MALPSVAERFPGIPVPGTGCLGLGFGLRKMMSSIVFLVLDRRASSTCGGAGWEESVVASVSTEGTDSLMVVGGCFDPAPVFGLSFMAARECWDIS